LEFVGIVEDLFGALKEVTSLERSTRAKLGRQLVEQDGIVLAVFNIV